MLGGMAKIPDSRCSIARTLGVLGERWTFLILREAFLGATRFAEFRARLGIAPDVLSDRLGTLDGIRRPAAGALPGTGSRSRFAYRLTEAGQELQVILGALQQWGDEHLPHPEGPSMLRRRSGPGGAPLHVGYIDDDGREVTLPDVRMIPAGSAGRPLRLPSGGRSAGRFLRRRTGRVEAGHAGDVVRAQLRRWARGTLALCPSSVREYSTCSGTSGNTVRSTNPAVSSRRSVWVRTLGLMPASLSAIRRSAEGPRRGRRS